MQDRVASSSLRLLVAGAGIFGVWQAFLLARDGHHVTLIDREPDPSTSSASAYAGAMLAPWCEAEAAPEVVKDLGITALGLWRRHYPETSDGGSLVVAAARDLSELKRFARMTDGHRMLNGDEIGACEPALEGRFSQALLFPDEAFVDPVKALQTLSAQAEQHGADVRFGCDFRQVETSRFDWVIDARGLGDRERLPGLRGVRGERVIIESHDVTLSRPVRLLHPRHPIYIVPWSGQRFMVGATVIENEEAGPITVRSMLELLGAAYAVHPAFADAEVVDAGAGVRPSYADNVPKAVVDHAARTIHVNGAYRHGYLLAPILAEAVAAVLASASQRQPADTADNRRALQGEAAMGHSTHPLIEMRAAVRSG